VRRSSTVSPTSIVAMPQLHSYATVSPHGRHLAMRTIAPRCSCRLRTIILLLTSASRCFVLFCSRAREDITNYETFANLQRWVDKITLEAEKNCSMILVGNKCETAGTHEQGATMKGTPSSNHGRGRMLILTLFFSSFCCRSVDLVESNPALRRVPLDEAKRYGASVNAMVVEASAKSGDSIASTFEQVVSIYFERAEATNQRSSTSAATSGSGKSTKVDGSNANGGGKKKCCS
jgi:hypothetical protein